ncbi:DUF1642 domain-containing protein [Streptococcus sp. CL9.43]|uniref:DUF1642 domain-containing protein n=1 Tax=Streptococcus sp. CL9.43 TaxID=3392238 RepID=UPI003C7DD724
MNVKELIEKIEALPAEDYKYRPYIDKKVVLGLVGQLDEPEKVKIPQFVADWIEKSKSNGWDLLASMCFTLTAKNKQVTKWLHLGENVNIFALAWIEGYEVEKEPKYIVKLKNALELYGTLNFNKQLKQWYFSDSSENPSYETKHTRKELEDAGFGWVFDCPGVEVEEVTE